MLSVDGDTPKRARLKSGGMLNARLSRPHLASRRTLTWLASYRKRQERQKLSGLPIEENTLFKEQLIQVKTVRVAMQEWPIYVYYPFIFSFSFFGKKVFIVS